MTSIVNLVAQMIADQTFRRAANLPILQRGPRNRPFKFSRILPERTVRSNVFRETEIKYQTLVANSGSRYSPVQMKEGALIGSFLVELGNSDIGSEFTARLYDTLLDMLNTNDDMAAAAELTNFSDATIGRSLATLREVERVNCIVEGKVWRTGDGGYRELVDFPDPSGHRETIPSGTVDSLAGWYDPTHDPMEDIVGKVTWLQNEKGLTVTQIFCSTDRRAVLSRNPKIQAYGAGVGVSPSGQLQSTGPISFPQAVDAAFARNNLPVPEAYDTRYNTIVDGRTTSLRIFPEDAFVMLCTTGRDQELDLGDEKEPIPLLDTLGYTAIGRAVGEQEPGVVVRAEAKESKPPRIEFEGWQTSFPVLQDPEALAVFRIPQPLAT